MKKGYQKIVIIMKKIKNIYGTINFIQQPTVKIMIQMKIPMKVENSI